MIGDRTKKKLQSQAGLAGRKNRVNEFYYRESTKISNGIFFIKAVLIGWIKTSDETVYTNQPIGSVDSTN
jgi:hypothetical protein